MPELMPDSLLLCWMDLKAQELLLLDNFNVFGKRYPLPRCSFLYKL